jgi:hypothetical protein
MLFQRLSFGFSLVWAVLLIGDWVTLICLAEPLADSPSHVHHHHQADHQHESNHSSDLIHPGHHHDYKKHQHLAGHHSQHNRHNTIKFGNLHLHMSAWEEIKQLVDCWAERGGSWDYMNITIIDNIYLYAACPLYYSIKNPCAWILDNQSLKYYWNPNYLENPKCLKILTLSDDNIDHAGQPVIVSEKNNGDRMDMTRLRSNTKITRLVDFDSPTMCYMLTSNSSYHSHQLDDVLLETDNAPSRMKGGILVIGDSISELIVSSLRNQILLGNNETCPKEGAQFGCHGQIKVDFIRNDWLSLIDEPRSVKTPTDERYETPWKKHLEEKSNEYSILILNRGAHYVPDEDLLRDLNETLTYITTNFPHLGILWRNTPQGDHGWKSHFFSPPLKEPLKLEANTKYFYDLFENQNEVVKQWLGKYFPQIIYFDVFTSTAMRRDARYDPMHPCVPGPVDTWSKFVYNILKYIYSNAVADIGTVRRRN